MVTDPIGVEVEGEKKKAKTNKQTNPQNKIPPQITKTQKTNFHPSKLPTGTKLPDLNGGLRPNHEASISLVASPQCLMSKVLL